MSKIKKDIFRKINKIKDASIITKIMFISVFVIIFQDTFFYFLPFSIIKYIDEFLVISAFFFAIYKVYKKQKKISKLVIALICLTFMFFLVGLLSFVTNSTGSIIDTFISSLLSVKFLLLLISIIIIEPPKEIINIFIRSIEWIAKIVAFFALINFLFPSLYTVICPFGIVGYRMGMVSVCSLFIHPGQYGWFMICISLLYLAKFICLNKKRDLRSYVVYSFCALLSFKVKVIISFFAIIGCALLIYYKNKSDIKWTKVKRKYLIVAILSIILILLFTGRLIVDSLLFYLTPSDNPSARYLLLFNSLRILIDYFPLGVGFGQYGSYYAKLNYSSYYYKYDMTECYGLRPHDPRFATDTFWPAIMGETGLIGLLCYGTFLSIIGFKLYNLYRKYTIYNFYLLWGGFILIQSIVESVGEPIYNSSPQFIIIALIVGSAINIKVDMNI